MYGTVSCNTRAPLLRNKRTPYASSLLLITLLLHQDPHEHHPRQKSRDNYPRYVFIPSFKEGEPSEKNRTVRLLTIDHA